MADPLYRVELTASFLERLDAIEAFLVEAGAGFAFDALVAELRATVVPNLQRFPRIGRRYLTNPPQSAEALAQLAAQLGFSTEARQSEAFLARFGLRPGAYREVARSEIGIAQSIRRMTEWQSVLR